MKTLPHRAVSPQHWDEVADRSSEAWLFHRAAWIDIESRFAVRANLSFALQDNQGQLIGIQPLYRRDLDRGWCERVLDSGYHRHTGLALRDGLAAEARQGAARLAMQHIFTLAQQQDVDRILLNRQNLAPGVLADRRCDLPSWVMEFGFELGLHMTPCGDLAVPGLARAYADQIVHLDASEDELFRKIDKAAVRKGQRSGLTFEPVAANPVAEYYELAVLSAQRTGEKLQPLTYYQSIWDGFGTTARAAFLFARSEGKPAGAVLLLLDKDAVSYLGGVSHPEFLSMCVSDFLHWQSLCWAKKRGCRYYRFGPIFPELPADWPVSQVSWFKSKFGACSYPIIQGNYFCKPERYVEDTQREAQRASAVRVVEVVKQRAAAATRCADPARDLVMILRRYGYLGVPLQSKAKDLVEKHGMWWHGCSTPFSDIVDRACLVVHAEGAALETFGVHCQAEAGPAWLHERRGWRLWRKRQPVYRALLPHCSFSGPDIEPIWQNAQGRAVLAWWHVPGRKVLLVGLDLAGELVRYTQGDPGQVLTGQSRSRWNFPNERANFLFDPSVVQAHPTVPWADRLGFQVVRLLARQTGLPLVEPLPGGAVGAVMLTGDDDQAALAKYQEQLELVGDFPISYFLLPFTKHTAATLAALPPSVEIGLHVDALEHPDQYESICADQATAVRALSGKPVRAIRNHGFLNRGYLGHLPAWEECGLTLDVNYAGLDGTALTGSFLPFRNRRPDGSWSQHISLLTAFGDGMLYISRMTEEHCCRRIEDVSRQIEQTDPGILVFNMHPENVSDARLIHRTIMDLARRPGWTALGAESYLQWLEGWQRVSLRCEANQVLVHSPQPVTGLVVRHTLGNGWGRTHLAAHAGEQALPRLALAG